MDMWSDKHDLAANVTSTRYRKQTENTTYARSGCSCSALYTLYMRLIYCLRSKLSSLAKMRAGDRHLSQWNLINDIIRSPGTKQRICNIMMGCSGSEVGRWLFVWRPVRYHRRVTNLSRWVFLRHMGNRRDFLTQRLQYILALLQQVTDRECTAKYAYTDNVIAVVADPSCLYFVKLLDISPNYWIELCNLFIWSNFAVSHVHVHKKRLNLI